MHRMISLTPMAAAALVLLLAGCRDSAELPEQATQGPNPTLPAPKEKLIPTLYIAKATGWKQGETPEAAAFPICATIFRTAGLSAAKAAAWG
jgi:hypothetical protein